jgi:hypothetical protein
MWTHGPTSSTNKYGAEMWTHGPTSSTKHIWSRHVDTWTDPLHGPTPLTKDKWSRDETYGPTPYMDRPRTLTDPLHGPTPSTKHIWSRNVDT